ncbi:hypothetical protein BH23GEM3_BH23GEM3_03550 [soil metagenome]
MFLLRRPSPPLLDRILDAQRSQSVSYPEVGMTRSPGGSSYPLNHHRIDLGSGSEIYAGAVAAVRSWAMYDLSWTGVYPANTPVEEGRVFATLANHFGFWSINPCRIVYVEDRDEELFPSFSFAIGTLPLHSERGEERFRVEWDRARDLVSFEILALAGPQHWLARLGWPIARILQRRFGTEALHAVHSTVRRARA